MPKKLLIVDDEEEVLFMLRTRFERLGYQVITAVNGREGIEKAQSDKPDLIILDVLMPHLSGYQMIGKIKELGAAYLNIPVIVVSAKATMKEFFDNTDIVTFIHKPFNAKDLEALVDKILQPSLLPPQNKSDERPVSAPPPASGGAQTSSPPKEAVKPALKPVPTPLPAAPPVSGVSGGGKRIVILGADESTLDKLKDFLGEKLGFSVTLVTEEAEAIQELPKKPAVMLCQFWEDSERLDIRNVYKAYQANPDYKSIVFASFIRSNLIVDAKTQIKNVELIPYQQTSELLAEVEKFLKNKKI